uniref:Uncharacterized protein n=1 Tax=Sus scrofa TaxID=9823 RepID=A0A4X1TTU3_PIG
MVVYDTEVEIEDFQHDEDSEACFCLRLCGRFMTKISLCVEKHPSPSTNKELVNC